MGARGRKKQYHLVLAFNTRHLKAKSQGIDGAIAPIVGENSQIRKVRYGWSQLSI